MTGYIWNISRYSPDSQSKNQEINSVLKEGSLPHVLDALDHECDTWDHQRHEVLERAGGIENSCSNVFITTQVKTDEGSTGQ
jgi:hypothetical protein